MPSLPRGLHAHIVPERGSLKLSRSNPNSAHIASWRAFWPNPVESATTLVEAGPTLFGICKCWPGDDQLWAASVKFVPSAATLVETRPRLIGICRCLQPILCGFGPAWPGLGQDLARIGALCVRACQSGTTSRRSLRLRGFFLHERSHSRICDVWTHCVHTVEVPCSCMRVFSSLSFGSHRRIVGWLLRTAQAAWSKPRPCGTNQGRV